VFVEIPLTKFPFFFFPPESEIVGRCCFARQESSPVVDITFNIPTVPLLGVMANAPWLSFSTYVVTGEPDLYPCLAASPFLPLSCTCSRSLPGLPPFLLLLKAAAFEVRKDHLTDTDSDHEEEIFGTFDPF